MNNVKVSKSKVNGYGLIIDKNGMPCIKNPLTVPNDVWNGLTDKQKEHCNSKVKSEIRRN